MLQHRCPTLPALWGGPGMVDKTRVESLASATQSACVRVSHIQQGIRFNVNPDANVKRLVHLLLRWTDWLAAAECRWWRWYILERAKGNIQDKHGQWWLQIHMWHSAESLCFHMQKYTFTQQLCTHVYSESQETALYIHNRCTNMPAYTHTCQGAKHSEKTDPHAHNSQVCELKPIWFH